MNDEEWKANAKATVKALNPGTKDEDIDVHQESAFYWGAENFRLITDWIGEALDILHAPDRFSNRDFFTVFYGIIDDSELSAFIRGKTTGTLKTFGVADEDVGAFIARLSDPAMRLYLDRIWKAKGLIEGICRAFTDDEKFLLRFLRHRRSHITLSKFSVSIESRSGAFKFKTTSWKRLEQLGRSTSVPAFRKLIAERLSQHAKSLDDIRSLLLHEEDNRFLPET